MYLLSLLAALFFISENALAYTGFDICNHGKEEVPSVICQGPSVLKDTIVKGNINVVGPLTAVNVTAASVEIVGNTDLQNTKIGGDVSITGNLKANNVVFEKNVTIVANTIFLHGTRVKGAMTISSTSANPELTMECGSVILGTLTFAGKAGVIKITDDSVVKGKITNGSMIFVKQACK